MAREITPEEVQQVADMVARARKAMEEIRDYDCLLYTSRCV